MSSVCCVCVCFKGMYQLLVSELRAREEEQGRFESRLSKGRRLQVWGCHHSGSRVVGSGLFVTESRKLKVLLHKEVRDNRSCESAGVCKWLMAEKVFQLAGFLSVVFSF